jgi:hypothetical protein
MAQSPKGERGDAQSKLQAPTPKIRERGSKNGASLGVISSSDFEIWNLGFLWNLGFGTWDFRASCRGFRHWMLSEFETFVCATGCAAGFRAGLCRRVVAGTIDGVRHLRGGAFGGGGSLGIFRGLRSHLFTRIVCSVHKFSPLPAGRLLSRTSRSRMRGRRERWAGLRAEFSGRQRSVLRKRVREFLSRGR